MVTKVTPKTIAPQRLKMSYEEYLEFAPEDNIVEWVAGEVIIFTENR